MILSIPKKIWFLSLLMAFYGTQQCALTDIPFDPANLRLCIEQLLCERFQLLQRLVDKQICEENELINNTIDTFNIRLKEFIASQQKISDAQLKEFITCRLERTERNLDGFICHKINCLGDFVEAQLDSLDCEILAAIDKITILEQNIDCFKNNLVLFLEVLDSEIEGNPFTGAFTDLITALSACPDALVPLGGCTDIRP